MPVCARHCQNGIDERHHLRHRLCHWLLRRAAQQRHLQPDVQLCELEPMHFSARRLPLPASCKRAFRVLEYNQQSAAGGSAKTTLPTHSGQGVAAQSHPQVMPGSTEVGVSAISPHFAAHHPLLALARRPTVGRSPLPLVRHRAKGMLFAAKAWHDRARSRGKPEPVAAARTNSPPASKATAFRYRVTVPH